MQGASGNGASQKPRLRLVSTLAALGNVRSGRFHLEHRHVRPGPGWGGALQLLREARGSDALVIDNDPALLCRLGVLHRLPTFRRTRLVSVDLVLLPPVGDKGRLLAKLKGWMLRSVDRFLLYHRDVTGYGRCFGIEPARCRYIPFKVDSWDRLASGDGLTPDGEYVLSCGRTLRDVPTFVAAMRAVPYPGVLLHQQAALMRKHGTRLDLAGLPQNLRAVEDGNDQESWLEHLRRAKLVVVSTVRDGINAAGVGTYLMAMAMKKCVIVTDSVATRDILRDEAIVVPAGDPAALAEAIRSAWENEALRVKIASAGRGYAERLGGEARLFSDIVEACGDLVFGEQGRPAPR